MTGRTPPSANPDEHEVLRRLQLDVTRRLDGLLHGDYGGLVPGQGSELGETRLYSPGDDVRRIDWNVTARSLDTHVRTTIVDRELETRLVVDLSPSVDFGTASLEKRDLVLSAAGAIGFLTARVGNRLGGMLLHPDGNVVVPARQGRLHLIALLRRIQTLARAGSGTTDLASALRQLGTTSTRRGLIVIISDFLDSGDWTHELRRLGTRHDIVAIEVLDPRELALPNVGIVEFVDPESGARREVDTRKAKTRDAYAQAATEQRNRIARSLRKANVDHLQLRTDRDWLLDLTQFVVLRRERLAARKNAG